LVATDAVETLQQLRPRLPEPNRIEQRDDAVSGRRSNEFD
jgi:hypothetical protein